MVAAMRVKSPFSQSALFGFMSPPSGPLRGSRMSKRRQIAYPLCVRAIRIAMDSQGRLVGDHVSCDDIGQLAGMGRDNEVGGAGKRHSRGLRHVIGQGLVGGVTGGVVDGAARL